MTELPHPLTPPAFIPPDVPPENLGEQQVHVWVADLRRFSDAHISVAYRIMNAAEQTKAQAIKRGRERYIASRWLLRTCLAHYTATSPARFDIARTDKGKPYLPHSNLHFSLSHSGHWALLAVAQNTPIGVDIEAPGRTRDLYGIASNYYHPEEVALLHTLEEAAQRDYFYRLWTLKEAFFKAIGTGISAGLDKVHFLLTDSGDSNTPGQNHPQIRAFIHPPLANADDHWQFQQWQLPEGELIALACAAPQPPQTIWFDALATPAFP